MATHIPFKDVEALVFERLCESIDSSFSRLALDLLRSRDERFLDLKIDAKSYSAAHPFSHDYLISSYLSKWKGFSSWWSRDTRGAAISSWTESEEVCRITNDRLRSVIQSNYSSCSADVRHVLSVAQWKISQILGPLDVKATLAECEWTSGATSETKLGVPLEEKMSKRIAVTRRALPYLRAMVESSPSWVSCFIGRYPDGVCSLPYAYKIVQASRFLTVPKNAKTDRCIAAEPAGNIFLQKGVGTYIRNRLRVHGVRLDTQRVNQTLAQRAFFDSLATIDLKAASDTIATEAVRMLLPSVWFEYLTDLRCDFTSLEKREVKLQKFSSMGNGFTFELESLLFYGLLWAVTQTGSRLHKNISVFGDDIICNSYDAERLISILQFVGFTVNVDKSFLDGAFFESCGKHFFRGIEVTPIFQKEKVDTPKERIRLYNRIFRYGQSQDGPYSGCTRDALRMLQRRKDFNLTYAAVSSGRTPAVPYWVEGDNGFLVSPTWIDRYEVNRGYYCHVLIHKSKQKPSRAEEALMSYTLLRRGLYRSRDPKGYAVSVDLKSSEWVCKKVWIPVQGFSSDDEFPLTDIVNRQTGVPIVARSYGEREVW